MICTESEAKTKWCPQARIYARYAAFNRMTEDDGNVEEAKCIGFACMMWEWVDYEMESTTVYIGYNHRPNQAGRERAEQHLRDGWEEYESSAHGRDYRSFKRPSGANRRGTCGLIHRGAP